MQSYGGPWTLLKLEILEKYLRFYVTALKKQNFKLCYIDAFAGSGDVNIKGIGLVPGSALRAIDYPFNRYIFIDSNPEYIKLLKRTIYTNDPKKNVDIIFGDCNQLLSTISSFPWYEDYWRGVIFLDPYAMSLNWSSLESIAHTRAFDLWYLFPLQALIRVLQKDGKIPEKNKERINILLGTDSWEKEIYIESPQMTLFGGQNVERLSVEGVKKYILKRLKRIFPEVSDKALVLRNPQNNSPLFLLCFAVSNPGTKAIKTSLNAADHILTH